MRRGTILVLGLLAASTALTAVPQAAEARPAILNALRGIVTGPLSILGGGLRHSRRHASHHHSRASRHSVRPATAATAAAATGGAGAAAAASSHANPAPETSGAASAMAAAPAAETQGRGSEPPREPAGGPQPRLGTMGPPAWPTAYEDVIGFALWPKDYGERLRTHGIGDVLATAFSPSGPVASHRRGAQQARADASGNTAVPAVTCGSFDLTASDWPFVQISSTTELNETQQTALDQLKTALNDAGHSIKATCRSDAGQTPVERLRSMQNTLWAVHDAAQLIRTPLARFYDSLTDEQKQQFAAPAAQAAVDPRAASGGEMARMCGMPAANELPIRQIDQSLHPTKAQRASLDAVQKKAFEMGQFLMASCLKPLPATPAERLDAAADRLTAVIFAASNVNMALNEFTSQLSDEQKAKLGSLR